MSKTTKGLVKAFLITVVLLAGLIFLTGGSAAKLAIRAHSFLFPSYKQTLVAYTVGEGQTLWEITGVTWTSRISTVIAVSLCTI